ncbi:MAG: peptide chain release factor 1 [Polyangiaceae bacterium]
MLPRDKLKSLVRRHEEVERLLCDPAVLSDLKRMNSLNRERTQLVPIVEAMGKLEGVEKRIREDEEALGDPDLGELARAELPELQSEHAALEQELRLLLLPKNPNDEKNTILEIRGGTGGEEAALFAADLFRMYTRYAEKRGWRIEIMSTSEASAGGLKEAIALVTGNRVYSSLRHESGVHRVQRVPQTEAQGRIHTSTATVAVLPEAEEVDLTIDEKELKIDIAASGGPGGQGVNTTNSAVQITHLPTGMIVKCQDERSQLKNKSKALKILRSRLLDIEREKQADALRDERRGMVKAGDRSEKIRTYNFPQNRLTDHRIGLTLYELDRIVEGDLDQLVAALGNWHQAQLLEQNPDGSGPAGGA